MSSNQVELALKNATSKSRTPVSMYQFDPIWIVLWEIIKTSHGQIFLFFSIMERIRKGSDLPKKKVGFTEHPTKILAHQVNAKVSSIVCWVFDSVRALENDVARACLMNSVRSRDAQKQWARTNLSQPRQRRQRERQQTKGLTSKTIALHVRYKSFVHFLTVLCKTTTLNDQLLLRLRNVDDDG